MVCNGLWAQEVSDALQKQSNLWSVGLGQSSLPPFFLVFHKMFPGGQIFKCLRIEVCFTENRNSGRQPLELRTVESRVALRLTWGDGRSCLIVSDCACPFTHCQTDRSGLLSPLLCGDIGRQSTAAWVSHRAQVRSDADSPLITTFGDRIILGVCPS